MGALGCGLGLLTELYCVEDMVVYATSGRCTKRSIHLVVYALSRTHWSRSIMWSESRSEMHWGGTSRWLGSVIVRRVWSIAHRLAPSVCSPLVRSFYRLCTGTLHWGLCLHKWLGDLYCHFQDPPELPRYTKMLQFPVLLAVKLRVYDSRPKLCSLCMC